MDRPYRRYEMLLPLRFNDRRPIPDELIVDTLLELEERFGAVSCESQRTRGYWRHQSESFRDELVRFPPTPAPLQGDRLRPKSLCTKEFLRIPLRARE